MGKLESAADQSKTDRDALETRLAGAGYNMLRSRAELGEVRHELGEVHAEMEDLRRNVAGTAAATSTELEVQLEAGEVRRRVVVSDMVEVGDGLINKHRLSRNQAAALKSALKGILFITKMLLTY